MWRWLKSLRAPGARSAPSGRSGREILLPGQHPPKKCPRCGSSRLMLAEDIEVGPNGRQHVKDVVFCEGCGREWELASGHERGSNPRYSSDGSTGGQRSE